MATKRVRLVQRRKTAGYTQERLAQHLGVERSTVVRWEEGEAEPQPWTRPRLALALKIADDELRSLLDDIVDSQVEADEHVSFVLDHPASVDLVTAARLHDKVRSLSARYDEAPSTGLLGAAGQLHGRVVSLREQGSDVRVRRALFEVEADSAILMSQLVWDASQRRNHSEPIRYLDRAIQAARHAREPSLESYAVLRKSFVALYGEKHPDKGRALADEAARVAASCSPSLMALAMLHVAEAHAMGSNRGPCEDALATAEAQIGNTDADDAAADLYSISEYNRLAGSCYLSLDLPDRAQPILEAATKSLTGRKSQAIALANLSLSLIRQEKLDEAAYRMHRTIDAVELTRGGGGLNLAFAAGQELRPWRSEVWAQEINDRLLSLMAAI